MRMTHDRPKRTVHSSFGALQIRVFCRVRPAPASAVSCSSDAASLRLTAEDGKEHGFTFDHVFGPSASQTDVFAQVADVVQSALDGYKVRPRTRLLCVDVCSTAARTVLPSLVHSHAMRCAPQVCLFSYGQTGAGKTHTMQGGTGQQQGIIPRSVHKVPTGCLHRHVSSHPARNAHAAQGLAHACAGCGADPGCRGWPAAARLGVPAGGILRGGL